MQWGARRYLRWIYLKKCRPIMAKLQHYVTKLSFVFYAYTIAMLFVIFSFRFRFRFRLTLSTFILNGNKSRYLSDIQRPMRCISDGFPLNGLFIHWIDLRILNTLSVSSNSSYAMDSFIKRFE
jgi:hypothetical protein